MGCPFSYDNQLKADLAAKDYNRKRRSSNMVAYKCTKCPKWHIRNEG